ncbi:ribosomal S6 kinase alpha-2 [Lecanosticta acicola]|uniref:Ribosomal S6 kinase alpha-2 n=1 Tax=Lecanosticta acicola TaxID=111012 RepID=A0AAI9EEA6_9PEZI|nr:ribosomal S6 kinase alpha-2 [Lecanosticta acicola]
MAENEEPQPAAYLVFRRLAQPDSDRPIERCIGIYANDEFDVGREDVSRALELEDRSVSNHHFRIRCVVYDDDGEGRVAPMVYARVLSSHAVIFRRHGLDDEGGWLDLTKKCGDMLLNSGDSLQLTRQVSVVFRMGKDTYKPPPLDTVQKAEVQRFSDRYQMTPRVLGMGGYAAVYVAVKRHTGRQFACKVLRVPTIDADEQPVGFREDPELQKMREKIAREYTVLKKLSHPNIIMLEKVFRTTHNVYIFQELFTAGDLLSYLDKTGPLPEEQAAVIIRQLLEAVKYLHDNHVVHRDIKPENILMTSWRVGARVVLTDFGQSRTIADMENAAKRSGVFRMSTMIGTHGYTAPEVYARVKRDLQQGSGYTQAVDIWAIGCVTATCLTNETILPDAVDLKTTEMTQLVQYLDVLDYGRHWDKVGYRAKDFIRGCLAPDESNRLTASACLEMEWFRHPYYSADFDAAYKRAIQDWEPKKYDEDIIELIDTSGIVDEQPPPEEQVSHHFVVKPPVRVRPASTDFDRTIGGFRPSELHASPIEVPRTPPSKRKDPPSTVRAPAYHRPPDTVTQTQSQSQSQSVLLDDFLPPPPSSVTLDQNLALASENSLRNGGTGMKRRVSNLRPPAYRPRGQVYR